MSPTEPGPTDGTATDGTATDGTQPDDAALEGTISWGELAAEVTDALTANGFEGAERQARLIVMRACGADSAEWPSAERQLATVRGVAAIDAMTRRRVAGEPLQYVLGEWSFRHLDLFVDHRVLIPRPETEVVAGLALAELERLAPDDGPVAAVDLGTGSGAIGLALLTEHRGADVWLTDASDDALAVARANLVGVGRAAARARVVAGDWFEALPTELRGGLGLVVSNPPYVADDEVLPAEVADWEPARALVSGPRGTEHIEHLIAEAVTWLQPDGGLVIEMSPPQTGPMAALAEAHYAEVEVRTDLTGRDRVVVARHPTPH